MDSWQETSSSLLSADLMWLGRSRALNVFSGLIAHRIKVDRHNAHTQNVFGFLSHSRVDMGVENTKSEKG